MLPIRLASKASDLVLELGPGDLLVNCGKKGQQFFVCYDNCWCFSQNRMRCTAYRCVGVGKVQFLFAAPLAEPTMAEVMTSVTGSPREMPFTPL